MSATEVQCPSSELVLECPACHEEIACEIKIFAMAVIGDDKKPQVIARTDIQDQPFWDHAFIMHTARLE